MTRNEIWEWYCSLKLKKERKSRAMNSAEQDARRIRVVARVDGERLILALFKGAKAERCGVYYMTGGGSHFSSVDGKRWDNVSLENLPFGGWYYWRYSGCKFEVVEGEKAGLEWMVNQFPEPYSYYYNNCKNDLCDWVENVERDMARHRREVTRYNHQKKIDDWLADLPDLPPDTQGFIDNVVFDGLHFAFGEAGSARFTCSACGATFTLAGKKKDVWKHGKFYDCPECGAVVKCHKTADAIRCSERLMIVQSYHDRKGNICSIKREMFVDKSFERAGEHTQIWDGCLIVLPLDGSSATASDCYYRDTGRWTDKNTPMFQHSKCYCYPNLSALDGTAYDRVAIEAAARRGWKLHYNNLMWNFRDMPQMEYLVKGNFYGLVSDMAARHIDPGLMAGDTAKDVLGLDGQGVARLRERQGGVTYLSWLRSAYMCGFKIPEKTIEYFCRKHISPHMVAEPLKYASPEQIANYIEKQRVMLSTDRYNCTADWVCTTWRDTLQMSAGFKLAQSKANVFPKDLRGRHAELVALRNLERERERAQEREERFPKVTPICDEIRAVYEWENAEYAVLVPHSVDDIIREGCLLRHCVGTPDNEGRYRYLERIQERESYIMFLRKKSDVDAPWYTMEVEPGGAVRQLRTTGDDEGQDRSEAKAALALWRREVAKRIGQSEREAAEVSREKRLREFEELRRNGNKIRNGKLAGRLLVEVLEADFKEYNEEMAG